MKNGDSNLIQKKGRPPLSTLNSQLSTSPTGIKGEGHPTLSTLTSQLSISPGTRPPTLVTSQVAVVGLGYVGLPLSLQFARSGVSVIGLDIDPSKIKSLNGGRSYIKHIPSEAIAELVKAKKFKSSTDFSLIRGVEAVIICVPTPLNKNREPDISYIVNTGKAIAPFLKVGRVCPQAAGSGNESLHHLNHNLNPNPN